MQPEQIPCSKSPYIGALQVYSSKNGLKGEPNKFKHDYKFALSKDVGKLDEIVRCMRQTFLLHTHIHVLHICFRQIKGRQSRSSSDFLRLTK